jgi:hypothetical protein
VTGPRQQPIAPVRRRGSQPAAESFDDPEIARGQSDALLGALGRMQLRLDVLAREQGEAFDKILSAIDRLNTRLDEYEEFTEAEDAQAMAALETTVALEAGP